MLFISNKWTIKLDQLIIMGFSMAITVLHLLFCNIMQYINVYFTFELNKYFKKRHKTVVACYALICINI